ncbi:MAG: hypothetical protein WA354_13265 [Terracidiphilus sp.]
MIRRFSNGRALGIMQLCAMIIQPNSELLTILRNNVRHIEENKDESLGPDAAEIKDLMLRRIAVIEAAIARLSQFASAGSARKEP